MEHSTVKMTARALRELMGEAFDYDEYEEGRRDARKLFKQQPELREQKIEEVKQVLESGNYSRCFGPSYWVGCLTEADLFW